MEPIVQPMDLAALRIVQVGYITPTHQQGSLVPRPTPFAEAFFAALPHPCIIVNGNRRTEKRGRPGNEDTNKGHSTDDDIIWMDWSMVNRSMVKPLIKV